MHQIPADEIHKLFERGVAVLSIDTEQMWGYYDNLDEKEFEHRYPGSLETHAKLLTSLCAAGVSATWFVVGGMALSGSLGARDFRMAKIPSDLVRRIPEGGEATHPLWYRRSFIRTLRQASPIQEIGLHGGLTHLIWTHPRATRATARWELAEGIHALQQGGISASSFSFPREEERFCELLPQWGIRSYRGRTPVLASRLGRSIPGALLRVWDELVSSSPPPVWPTQPLPGIWNIPSSLFLYPIGPKRSKLLPLRSRIERFRRGLDAATRFRGIFHFCLHPENLAESIYGISMFEGILEHLLRAKERGDVEIMTVRDVVSRVSPCTANKSVALIS